MGVLKPILISSVAIPGAILLLFVSTGVAFMAIELFKTGSYDSGWLGLVYAGMAYAYIAALASTIPTIVLGLPASLIARKYGLLTKKLVLGVAPLLGALSLSIVGAVVFKRVDLQVVLWLVLAGGLGGLVNGYVFRKTCKGLA